MKRILHALEYSIPQLAGYTIRSKYIIDNQQNEGITPTVITSPLHGKTDSPLSDNETIDGVRYYRTGVYNKLDMNSSLPLRLLQRFSYSREYMKSICWVAKKEEAQVIHSHSSYLNGIRANKAAKSIGIPSVYEVRGLWQDTALINTDIDETHWKYRLVSYLDRKAVLGADKVVTLSQHLKREIMNMGVREDQLHVVPNGVDTNIFIPKEKDCEIVKSFGLENKMVFGFIGSITKIEGLSLFLENLHRILKTTKDFRVMLIGDGNDVENLKQIVKRNNLGEYVIFTGRVNHEKIFDYYSVIDVFLYPRIDAKVNHKVTPLKPLEAMSMQKVVIASDVGGLRELVEDNNNGLLFRVGDGEHLTKKCCDLIDNSNLIKELGIRARSWTVKERDWSKIIKLYNAVYDELLH